MYCKPMVEREKKKKKKTDRRNKDCTTVMDTPMLYNDIHVVFGAPVAQWFKRWPTDLADRVRSSLEVKSSQP